MMLISLALAGVTRQWAAAERSTGPGALPPASASGNLSRMNSYALALLLGGLRGPLVMFLWPSAEEQKIEKNLEDFDTKIEWIRLLQAEFDTVHIFQIWNKAWNVSVQMSSLANKYSTILDALDYGLRWNSERPNNINCAYAIARVYDQKLGQSDEKSYYGRRIRSETRSDMLRMTLPTTRRAELIADLVAAGAGTSPERLAFSEPSGGDTVSVTLPKAIIALIRGRFSGPDVTYAPRQPARTGTGAMRTALDPMLDEQGRILPQYLTSRNPRPADLDPKSNWNDGSELQYLKQYEPFTYGVSPMALGFNYYKQAQVLQFVNHQQHAEQTEVTISSRPAVALRLWADETLQRARRSEIEAFGKPVPELRDDMETVTADLPPTTAITRTPLIEEALFEYQRTAQVSEDSIGEYERHLEFSKQSVLTTMPHIHDLEAERAMALADRDYLLAMLDPAKRQELIRSSAEHYASALDDYRLILLQYYIPDELAARFFPMGLTRGTIKEAFNQKKLSTEQLAQVYSEVLGALPPDLRDVENRDLMLGYMQNIARTTTRLSHLK
jgi:hypothetical protein